MKGIIFSIIYLSHFRKKTRVGKETIQLCIYSWIIPGIRGMWPPDGNLDKSGGLLLFAYCSFCSEAEHVLKSKKSVLKHNWRLSCPIWILVVGMIGTPPHLVISWCGSWEGESRQPGSKMLCRYTWRWYRPSSSSGPAELGGLAPRASALGVQLSGPWRDNSLWTHTATKRLVDLGPQGYKQRVMVEGLRGLRGIIAEGPRM